ncbi:MliC family protein [Tateyamaria sp.]
MSENAPSFDCAKAESSTETLICENTELARLDRLIAARYAAAVKAIRELDTGSSQAEKDLRATQRGLIKGRDECWKSDDPTDCIRAAYLRREGELVGQWLLEEPSAIVIWTCDGNPANEVVTYFFDTEVPSVRFERGDSIDTGQLVRTASGSAYEGSFGRSIWTKGDVATYKDPDPNGQSYSCVRATQ